MRCVSFYTPVKKSEILWFSDFLTGYKKIHYMGKSIQEWTKGHGLLKQIISLHFLKGYLPQNLLSPLLNTLSHMNPFLARCLFLYPLKTSEML